MGLLLAACGNAPSGSTGSPEPETGVRQSALASGQANSQAGARAPRLGHLHPESRKHPTGALLPTAEEARLQAERGRTVIEVRPTPLALERIRGNAEEDGATTSAAPSPSADIAGLEGEATQLGSDLVTAPAANAPAAGSVASSALAGAAVTLPKSLDNSTLKPFPEIRDQGGLLSCEAFAIAYYQYTHEIGLLAGWDNKSSTSTNATKISPKWLYNMSSWGDNGGTGEWTNYQLLMDHGALTWADFPYSGDPSNPLNYRQWAVGTSTWEKALRFKGVSWASLPIPTDAANMQQVKTVLLNGHVLTFFNFIYGWMFDQIDDDPNTTADDPLVGQEIATWVNGTDGGHLMTLVGYNDDLWVDLNGNRNVDPGEKGAFKIANSWGNSWSNAGFTWVAYDALYWASQVSGMPEQPGRSAAMWSLNSVVPRSNYQPNLVAEMTLTTAERSSMGLAATMAETDRTEPLNSRYPQAFNGAGGPYAFDGTSGQAKSASFAVDLSDFVASYGDLKYGLRLTNYSQIPDKLSGLTFLDRLKSNQRTASTDPAVTVNAYETKSQTLRYQFKDSARVPQLTFTPSSSIAFGNVAVGNSSSRVLTVQNKGTGDALITSLRLNNPLFYVTEVAPITLARGASTQLHVQFAPASSQSEMASLNTRNTSQNVPNATLSLGGTGTSTNDSAPLAVYITQQNDPFDSAIHMRVEVKNRATTALDLSKDRVVYFLNDPQVDYSTLIWDTYYNSGPSPLGVKLRRFYVAKAFGQRTADTALEFTFPAGTSVAPGSSLIFQGSLHRGDYSWYPNETLDWSRYLRRDGMAEGTIVQDIASKTILFGSSPELPAGTYQLGISPNPVSSDATVTFTVTDPKFLNTGFVIEVRNSSGALLGNAYHWISTLGTQTVTMWLSSYNAGDYTLVLKANYTTAVDFVDFTKL